MLLLTSSMRLHILDMRSIKMREALSVVPVTAVNYTMPSNIFILIISLTFFITHRECFLYLFKAVSIKIGEEDMCVRKEKLTV